MRRKQRKRRHERRRAHRPAPDRPRSTIHQDSYTEVKKGHIVPVAYQRSWAVNAKVAVHVNGTWACHLTNVKNAGARSRPYRRTRSDGTPIDDIETVLSRAEATSAPMLADVVAGEPLTSERKAFLAQFFALQMLRGPAFFQTRERIIEALARDLTAGDISPELLSQAGDDLQVVRTQAIDAFTHETQALMDMLLHSLKAAAVFGGMRWVLLGFDDPVVAYSDQPVVVWPMSVPVAYAAPAEPTFAPLSAMEVRIPLSPALALLMTWADRPDTGHAQPVPADFAGELNAFTVAQADKQWMHCPGSEPPIATGPFSPLATRLERGYSAATAQASRRWQETKRFLRRVKNRRFINDIPVLDVKAPT